MSPGPASDARAERRAGRRAERRAATARLARWIGGTSYLQRWLVLGTLIGAIAGFGALVFYEALVLATHVFLEVLVGYTVPTPVGEGLHAASSGFARPWALPLVVGGGGLLAGAIVFGFAPEAEGHGTDAAIAAVHHNPRGIRFRAVVVKIVASAITIGSGGSGGREGPTGQISAGFGSLLARLLDLSPNDARIAVSAGIGSGIGAIFGAPLGGAVLSTEILYRDDIDPSALLPSFFAAIVGYVVFASWTGFSPLFGFAFSGRLVDPTNLVFFALIGVVGGVVGLLYAKGFYGMAEVFTRLPVPRWVNPGLAGLVVGLMGLAVPEVLGTGYGWVQTGLGHDLLSLPLWIVVALPFLRIVATGLSIGSGGSGGIFGPGMVIGAFVGAAVWRLFEPSFHSMGSDPAPFVIVGMMCCFGSISRAPLAVMIMVAEMTGSLPILAPAMLAVGLAWIIVRRNDDTIYRSQLKSRADSLSQRMVVGMPLLANVTVDRAMALPRLVMRDSTSPADAFAAVEAAGVPGVPVVDAEGRWAGTVSAARLAEAAPGVADVGALVDATAPSTARDRTLDEALDSLTASSDGWITVLDDDRHVVGTLAIPDLVASYRQSLLSGLRTLEGVGRSSGMIEVEVAEGSRLDGRAVMEAGLPPGALITSVQRGSEIFVPNGETRLRAHDRLAVVGREADEEVLRKLATDAG